MSILNQVNCASSEGNTGIGDCFYVPDIIEGALLVPPSFELTEADLATEQTLQDAIQDALVAPIGQRIYMLPKFVAITDNSADPITATLGYGGIVTIDDGDVNWTMQFLDGGLCVNNQLRKFNKGNYRFLFIDKGGIFGTKTSDGTGMRGIPKENFYAFPWKANDRTNPTQFRVQFVFKPKYINEQIAFASVQNVSLLDLLGVQNVTLANVSRAANVLTVSAKLSCGGKNLVEMYPTEFADPTLVKVVNSATGNEVSITSVSVNGVNNLVITLSAVDADYNTTAGGMTISLAAPDVLLPEIGAYESNKLLSIVA